MSTLVEVRNAQPLVVEPLPILPFEVAKPGDVIEPGVEYGYPIYTHCGLPTIGPLNDTYWAAEDWFIEPWQVITPGTQTIYGFIRLTDNNTILPITTPSYR